MVHHEGRPDIFKGPATKYNEEELKEIIDSDIKKFPNEEIGSDAYIALLELSSELSDYFVPFEELDFYEDEETF